MHTEHFKLSIKMHRRHNCQLYPSAMLLFWVYENKKKTLSLPFRSPLFPHVSVSKHSFFFQILNCEKFVLKIFINFKTPKTDHLSLPDIFQCMN